MYLSSSLFPGKRGNRRSEVCGVSLRADVVNAAKEVSLEKNPNAMLAVIWGGFACGVLDITAALVVYGYLGLKPVRLLQGIASGLLGAEVAVDNKRGSNEIGRAHV